MESSRTLALKALLRMEEDQAYSNLVLDEILARSSLSRLERSFTSALFYGVLERRLTLDHVIAHYSNRPLDKLSPAVLTILRMGVYQLLYMDSVPDSAAVNESVKLTYSARIASAKGFVNACLRSFIRDEKPLRLPDKRKDRLGYYSIKYACPRWLLEKWTDEYGEQTAIETARASIGRPPLAVRVNTLRTTADALAVRFAAQNIDAQQTTTVPDCLLLSDVGGIGSLKQYQQGLFHVQDISSQLCAAAVDPQPGETVLDLCSAPGGKAFTMAERMGDRGKLIACDLYPQRTRLIEEGAIRLGIGCIETRTADAAQFDPSLEGIADRVLCDVPCSGLGVIRRKPEIKYKSPEGFDTLPQIQYNILIAAARYLRPGGRLVYSTCTLSKAENDQVIGRFLAENPSFAPTVPKNFSTSPMTIFPYDSHTDGFFIAVLQKSEGI